MLQNDAYASNAIRNMASYDIYIIMGFIILQNPIKSLLHLTAVLSMQVNLSK